MKFLRFFRKKKKKKSKEKAELALSTLEAESSSSGTTATTSTSSEPIENYYRTKTKSEIAFIKRKEEMDKERIRQKAAVSHKERVEKFNNYLDSLSEHYEPAKVSWTK